MQFLYITSVYYFIINNNASFLYEIYTLHNIKYTTESQEQKSYTTNKIKTSKLKCILFLSVQSFFFFFIL